MDDWSLLPSRNAVSEPAPNPQSTMNTTTLPARLTRPRQAPPAGADHPCPQPTALDPAGLAWQPATNPGRSPETPAITGLIRHRPPEHALALHRTTPGPLTTPGPSWMTQDVHEGSRPAPAGPDECKGDAAVACSDDCGDACRSEDAATPLVIDRGGEATDPMGVVEPGRRRLGVRGSRPLGVGARRCRVVPTSPEPSPRRHP